MPIATTAPVYATIDDLASCGVPPESLADVGPVEKQRALYQASRTADQRLSARYRLPLVSWDDGLTWIVCAIASFRLLSFRGWNPSDPANGGVVMMYNDALKTLDKVAQGDYTLDLIDTQPEPIAVPDVSSDKPRGL